MGSTNSVALTCLEEQGEGLLDHVLVTCQRMGRGRTVDCVIWTYLMARELALTRLRMDRQLLSVKGHQRTVRPPRKQELLMTTPPVQIATR